MLVAGWLTYVAAIIAIKCCYVSRGFVLCCVNWQLVADHVDLDVSGPFILGPVWFTLLGEF